MKNGLGWDGEDLTLLETINRRVGLTYPPARFDKLSAALPSFVSAQDESDRVESGFLPP